MPLTKLISTSCTVMIYYSVEDPPIKSNERVLASFFDPLDCSVERLCLICGEVSILPLSSVAIA